MPASVFEIGGKMSARLDGLRKYLDFARESGM